MNMCYVTEVTIDQVWGITRVLIIYDISVLSKQIIYTRREIAASDK